MIQNQQTDALSTAYESMAIYRDALNNGPGRLVYKLLADNSDAGSNLNVRTTNRHTRPRPYPS